MLNPSFHHIWNGVYIEGQEVGVQFFPQAEGTISVQVIANPAITGFTGACGLSEASVECRPGEIAISDARLDCLAADKLVPYCRFGFRLALEPGMAQILREWMPKLTVAATLSKTIADHFQEHTPQPIYHLTYAITSVVSRVVLAGWDVSHSIAFERKDPRWKNEDVFMGLFDSAATRALLDSAAAQAAAWAHSPDAHA